MLPHGLARRIRITPLDALKNQSMVGLATGRHLWHFNMGELLTASPVTYAVDGKQYVAIVSATAVFSFGLFEPSPSVPLLKINVQK